MTKKESGKGGQLGNTFLEGVQKLQDPVFHDAYCAGRSSDHAGIR